MIHPVILGGINPEPFDRENHKNIQEADLDIEPEKGFTDYKVLVMMFYEGLPGTIDKNLTRQSFIHGPAEKMTQKGFQYNIATTYKDALNELLTGQYSIAVLATCSDGYEGNENNDANYFEPFLNTIVKFYCEGGSLILYGENPPFVFETNHILQRLPDVNVIFDENEFEEGGKTMQPSNSKDGNIEAGQFLGPECTFNAEINGEKYEDIPSIGAGILKLDEGRILGVYKTTDGTNIEDSFHIFSKSSSGKPACIFKVPKDKKGALFIDNNASIFFNDHIESGFSQYFSNLLIGTIFYSHFRESCIDGLGNKSIKVDMSEDEITPRQTKLMKTKNPLLITFIIDATDSMQPHIDKCKSHLSKLIKNTINKVNPVKIYYQVVAYRDFSENAQMVEPYPITDSLQLTIQNIGNIRAFGGCDPNENISVGFEKALEQIEEFKTIEPNAKNIFILIADSPNHDEDIKIVVDGMEFYGSDRYIHQNQAGVPWKEVWLGIDEKMSTLGISKLACVAVKERDDDFTRFQYQNWRKYGCEYINQIVRPYTVQTKSFQDIFVEDISEDVNSIFQNPSQI